ncbi:MAG: chemotaxis protein CheA [Bacteriovoracia bacterium]
MSENDDLLPDFLAETTDMIDQIRRDMETLNGSEGDRGELLNSIFRAVHTIKGGASVFNYENTKAMAHKLENLLDVWRNAPERFTKTESVKITKVIDYIETLLQNSDQPPPGSQMISSLKLQAEPQATDVLSQNSVLAAGGDNNESELVNLSVELRAVAAESLTKRPPDEPIGQNKVSSGSSQENRPLSTTSSTLTGTKAQNSGSEMLRVPVDRVQRNLDVISEVFLIRNQMTYLVEKYFSGAGADHAFVQAWESLDNSLRRSIGELENVAMSMRMMPITGLFSRMEKTVRAYTEESGKRIQIQKGGEHTELDKKVLDALGEPLIHLIRNAMDHGIESPDARAGAGKPESGTIILSAKVAGNEVIIAVQDDGKGISADKIRQAALAKGIDVSRANDEKSAIDLIFLPGFSTASSVTETSGRGVGMDVVKSAIERLGGSIEIHTKLGKGTTFLIRLPLSMSVIPAIVVRLNEVLYAVGTADIIETRRMSIKEIKMNADEGFIRYRDIFIPCYNLEHVLQGHDTVEHGYQSSVFICIVRHKDGYIALRVGALENNTEIVVKPMPTLSPHISYVTGISVLPTGHPVFVLSLGRLCREKFASVFKSGQEGPKRETA